MRTFWIFLLALFFSSCVRTGFISEDEPATALILSSTKETNGGAPLYIVLKFTDFPHFLMDDYESIAELCMRSETDSSFAVVCLIPGKSEKMFAKPPAGLSTGVYCLFTQCGECWKQLIERGGEEVTVVLGEHAISAIEMR